MPIKTEIYRYLKKNGDSTAQQIAQGISRTLTDVKNILEAEVVRGYIRKDYETFPVNYSVRIKLGRLVRKEEIIPLWRHEDIIQRAAPEKASVIPPALIKALLEALIWWQGGRGTCVGFAGALYKWRMYIEATGHIPTIEEIKAACKIIEEDIGCTAGKFKYMTMPPGFWSPQWIYDRSRKFGNCTYPAGSDTTWAAKVIANEGAVPWEECLTSITGMCAPELWIGTNVPYAEALAKLAPIAAEHKNKFSATNDFNTVFQAIKDGRAVFGPVNLPPDYLNPPNGEWLPYGGDSAGGHAIFCCLSDDSERKIASRGSWDGDDGEKWYWMGERFFNDNAGPFLIGLTQAEAVIGETLYSSITVTSNVPAQLTVDGKLAGNTPIKVAIEKGKTYIMMVSATGFIAQSRAVDESLTVWNVTLEPSPVPKKNWLEKLIDWIMSLFRRN
jgi:hypothetical protein